MWWTKFSYSNKLLSAWDLFQDLSSPRECFITHTHAASSNIVNISRGKTKWHRFVWLCDSFRAYNDLASVSISILVTKSSSEHLSTSSHELTHSGVEFADGIVVAISITINHDKLKVLHLFEEVIALEACREIWVEWIHDLLCPANFSPVAVNLFDQETPRVWLAECVQVAKFAAWDEKLDFLTECVCCWYHPLW